MKPRPFAHWPHHWRWASAFGVIALFVILMAAFRQPAEPQFGALPDFSVFDDVQERKAAFFGYLRPIVEHHNERIREQRDFLLQMRKTFENDTGLTRKEARRLQTLAGIYEVPLDEDNPERTLRQLLMRVDVIPVELALVQAAKESGWGRSRFAVTANNLFGQWCFEPGCGVVPARRGSGKTHEVEKFGSVSTAIRQYMNNLNTNDSYKRLRQIRAGLRAAGAPINGLALADGLLYYSERRGAYVSEVKSMIRQYRRFSERRSEEA